MNREEDDLYVAWLQNATGQWRPCSEPESHAAATIRIHRYNTSGADGGALMILPKGMKPPRVKRR